MKCRYLSQMIVRQKKRDQELQRFNRIDIQEQSAIEESITTANKDKKKKRKKKSQPKNVDILKEKTDDSGDKNKSKIDDSPDDHLSSTVTDEFS